MRQREMDVAFKRRHCLYVGPAPVNGANQEAIHFSLDGLSDAKLNRSDPGSVCERVPGLLDERQMLNDRLGVILRVDVDLK